MATWLDRIRSFFVRAAPAALTKSQFEGGLLSPGASGRGPPARGTRELIRAYRQSPWLRAVTSRIARGVGAIQWTVFARAAEATKTTGRDAAPWRWGRDRAVRDVRLARGDRSARARVRSRLQRDGVLREVPDHPVLSLLAQPNEMMSGSTALKVTQVWLDLKGEAFWLLSLAPDGTPSSAWPVPPHWVTAVPTPADPFFTVSTGMMQLKVDPKSVLWLRDVDPEHPYGRGTGIAEALGDELETDEYAAKYLKAWFFNSASPSVIVSFESVTTSKQLEEARESWERNHRGVHNAHRAHFAAGKMNAVKLDTAFREQQLVELRQMERDVVIQVFGVPPECIGVIENSNRATIDAAGYMYAHGVEHPRCEFLRAELGTQLLSRFPGGDAATLEYELSAPADSTHRLEVMRAQPVAFTLNEWRSEAGHDALPELEGRFPAALPGQNEVTPAAEEPAAEEDVSEESAEELERRRGDPPWALRLSHGTRNRVTALGNSLGHDEAPARRGFGDS